MRDYESDYIKFIVKKKKKRKNSQPYYLNRQHIDAITTNIKMFTQCINLSTQTQSKEQTCVNNMLQISL